MEILSFIFFTFLSIAALVGCFRALKLVIRLVNSLFDRLDEKIH